MLAYPLRCKRLLTAKKMKKGGAPPSGERRGTESVIKGGKSEDKRAGASGAAFVAGTTVRLRGRCLPSGPLPASGRVCAIG
jgi:hypothetical protein